MAKGPKFSHKEKPYSTRFIGAAKKDDGEYESEAECRARVKDMFDIDDVPCMWDEDRKGFVPMTGESTDVPSAPSEPEPEDDKSEGEDPVVEVDLNVEDKDHTEDIKPEPSVDGERVYELSEAKGASGLQSIIDQWSWEEGDEALMDKLMEEANEAKSGTRDKLVLNDSTLKVIGLAADSEMLTVGCIVFKWLNGHGLNVEDSLKAMELRHREQFERYNAMQQDD